MEVVFLNSFSFVLLLCALSLISTFVNKVFAHITQLGVLPSCVMFQKPELSAESYEAAVFTILYFSISLCRANRRKLNKPASGLLVVHGVII